MSLTCGTTLVWTSSMSGSLFPAGLAAGGGWAGWEWVRLQTPPVSLPSACKNQPMLVGTSHPNKLQDGKSYDIHIIKMANHLLILSYLSPSYLWIEKGRYLCVCVYCEALTVIIHSAGCWAFQMSPVLSFKQRKIHVMYLSYRNEDLLWNSQDILKRAVCSESLNLLTLYTALMHVSCCLFY